MAGEDQTPAQNAKPPSASGAKKTSGQGGSRPAAPGQGRPGPRSPNPPPQNQPGPGGSPVRGKHVWHGVAYIVVALVALYLFQHYLLGPLGAASTLFPAGNFDPAAMNFAISSTAFWSA